MARRLAYLLSAGPRRTNCGAKWTRTPRVLLWQVLWEGGRITGIGIAIGVVLAGGAGQFLTGILYGLNSVEPAVLVTAPLILFVASLLASLIPALRPTRVNPTVALRAE